MTRMLKAHHLPFDAKRTACGLQAWRVSPTSSEADTADCRRIDVRK